MQLQTKPQTLIHIEKFNYLDKTTKVNTAVTKLHFADVSSSRVSAFSFKGDLTHVAVGFDYILDIGTYSLPDGKSGFTLKSLTKV